MSYIDAWFANAKSGSVGDINQLVSLKAVPIDIADPLGNTALHYSATAGHASVVEALIRFNANLNSVNKIGDTPLHKAASRGRLECVKLLVAAKANVDIRNKDDERPIDLTNNEQIRTELLPIIEDYEDDDEDEKKDDSDYDSDEEPDEE
eukprot:gene13611-16018_t